MMTAAEKKDAVRLRMEISYVGPESALSDLSKPANFLFVLGHDTNGRSSKAIFSGPLAKRLRDDLAKTIEGSDLKTRRPAIEVAGEWGFAKEPRKKDGEIVKDAAGKPVHERQFTAKEPARLMVGPVLELFRAQRAASHNMKAVAKLQADMEAAEKAGDLATALAKSKAAHAIVLPYLEQMTKRGGSTAAPATSEEYQATVAAATEGATNEPLSESPSAPEPEAARPIPDTDETAPAIKPAAPAPRADASAPQRPGIPRTFARPRPVAQIVAEKAALAAAAAPEATADTIGQVDSSAAQIESTEAPIQPQIDPEAAAEARFAKAGMDFVDADATTSAPELSAEPKPEPAPETPPPPPPTERPVPQPPSEAPRPAPPRRMGFPSMRR